MSNTRLMRPSGRSLTRFGVRSVLALVVALSPGAHQLKLLSQDLGSMAAGSALTVRVGPPSIGTGGTNPISIPPLSPIEYEVTYLMESRIEQNYGITPGFLVGWRSPSVKGLYSAAGGGLVISYSGVGPGIYTSFGFETTGNYRFNIEYKQALGYAIGSQSMISPYAVRLGVTFEL